MLVCFRFEATHRKSNLDFIKNMDDWQEIKIGLDSVKENSEKENNYANIEYVSLFDGVSITGY